jgi:hypothetical protein
MDYFLKIYDINKLKFENIDMKHFIVSSVQFVTHRQ